MSDLRSGSIVRSPFPDFQVDIKILLTDREHLSDIQLLLDSLTATAQQIQGSTVVIEDTMSSLLVGKDQVQTYIRTYKIGHFPERHAYWTGGKWK